jgi:hypothetical protein
VDSYVRDGILNSHTSTFKHLRNTHLKIFNLISAEILVIQNQFGVIQQMLTRDGSIVMNLNKVILKAYGAIRDLNIEESKIFLEVVTLAKTGTSNLHTSMSTL